MPTPNLDIKNSVIFIFGGNGDLSQRKLMPALFNLYLDGLMPANFHIVCFGRTPIENTNFRKLILNGIKKFSRRKSDAQTQAKWKKFAPSFSYQSFDAMNKKSYSFIAQTLKEKEAEWKATPTAIFYLAVAPQLVPTIAKNLGTIPFCKDCSHTRIVIEKPFGHNLQSAEDLNSLLKNIFKEKQIYRIDHYLGKETVQNILALRFANAMLEPVWNKNYIDHVQITNAENLSIEGRGDYYERSGALRDMVQNHILQMVCMIAMEAPISFDANEIRNKQVDVLNAIRKVPKEELHNIAVRGQYSDGWLNGKKIKGYREEEKVNAESNVETYAALQLYIDNWRWEGVPFFIRTGKSLHVKNTSITIHFKPTPNYAFPPEATENWRSNVLTINIQPDNNISLNIQAKRPGQRLVLNPVNMEFNYKQYDAQQPEAYETLLLDVMEGNPTLFMRDDQVEAAWKIINPILEYWQNREAIGFPNYTPGSWGPEDAEVLIAKFGFSWINPPLK